MVELAEYTLVTEPSSAYLNPRQQQDYRDEREACLRWLLAEGKSPDEFDGYAPGTVKPRSARMDQFYRFVWDKEGGYTINVDHGHADAWQEHLARRDVSATHKRNCTKALKMLYKWHHHQRGMSPWEPAINFARDTSTQPRDYLTKDERQAIRQSSLEYGTVPSYSNLVPAERDRWKSYLAQRFQIPKGDVSPEHWDRANSWKIPSLVNVSLDAGLRPIEVERASEGWVDVDSATLRIPKDQSSKNRENWIVGLRERTGEILGRWMKERRTRPEYDNTDAVWLTRENNRYQTQSLRYLLHRLCDIAGIHRDLSWYALRHSTGTYLTREEGLEASRVQLRHKSPTTTMKYDQVPVETRQDALNRMG